MVYISPPTRNFEYCVGTGGKLLFRSLSRTDRSAIPPSPARNPGDGVGTEEDTAFLFLL
jgi:hypothetical protein